MLCRFYGSAVENAHYNKAVNFERLVGSVSRFCLSVALAISAQGPSKRVLVQGF